MAITLKGSRAHTRGLPRGSMYLVILGIWVIGMIVQVSGKYMIIGYLDPSSKLFKGG